MKIIVNNAYKKYKSNTVLSDINCVFETGKAYGIVGNNASGKTQLMKAICGHTTLTSGDIFQDEVKIRNKNNFIMDAGIIIETPSFIPDISVKDNLEKIRLILNKTTKEALDSFINEFNLQEHINKLYKNISLGTKQKMLVIQALIDSPEILILDEAFNSLDQETSEILRKYLIEFKKNGIVILSSHYSQDIDMICDEIIVLEEGKIKNDA